MEPRFPVTSDYVARSRQQLAEAFPDWNESVVEHAVAQDVAINVFGPEWWARSLAADQPESAACATKFRVFENESPRAGFNGLSEVMRALSPKTVVTPARLD